jgi:beta-glucosidase
MEASKRFDPEHRPSGTRWPIPELRPTKHWESRMPLGTRAELPAFLDPGLPLRERADDLLRRLTSAEKIAMLHQRSPGVPRLGIAPFRTGTEALHGAAWLGVATVFPQAVGLGAAWDLDLVNAVGAAVGEEVRAIHRRDPAVSLNVWAPVVNLLRDPRWGRNEEGYSEDPLLTSRTAVAYCAGLRGDHPVYLRTAPLLKHFLAYNNETDRATASSVLRPRVLHEYELPVFHAPIAAGVAVGVMPSYNLVNGRPNHVSPYLERELRRWTDDELVVCSDAEAPSNLVDAEHYFADHPAGHAAALRAGVDSFTDHGEDSSVTVGRITEALERGLLTLADVDRAVRRLLLLRLRLGEFDPDLDPYADAGPGSTGPGSTSPGPTGPEPTGPGPISTGAHRDLARRAARQAIVLLKNDDRALPITPRPGLRIAVVGPFADRLCEDWYSGTMPYQVTIAEGLREALRPVCGEIICAEGVDRVTLRAAAAGERSAGERSAGERSAELAAEEVAAGERSAGELAAGELAAEEVAAGERSAEELAAEELAAEGPAAQGPAAQGPAAQEQELGEFDVFGWGGNVVTLRAVASGRYLTVKEDGSLAADQDRPNGWVVREAFVREARADGSVLLRSAATGRYVTVDASHGRLAATAPDAARAQRLSWHVTADGIEQAVRAMQGADAVVVVVGNDPLINGRETQDRTTLALPPAQDRLVRAACEAGRRVVLLVMSSYPYALTWAQDNVPAIAWTCHGGQETGRAVAEVLLGEQDPTGRLPQTWYVSLADLPGLLEYDIIKARRTYLYFEGTPLFPFGHGLSYATYGYAHLRLDATEARDGDTVMAALEVTNTGTRTGTEVVQLYTRALAPRCPRPRRQLAGFARVTLRPGETATVGIPLPVSSLAFWDVTTHRMAVDPGNYEVMAGSSSAAIRQSTLLTIRGWRPAPRPVIGVTVQAADFDDYDGITLVDATPADGDAVALADGDAAGSAGDGAGWILLRAAQLADGASASPASASPAGGGSGRLAVTARVAREEPGEASLELWCDHPAYGQFLGSLAVPCTGGRYTWTEVSADLVAAEGVRDLYVVLRGRQRLASIRVRGAVGGSQS